MPRRMGTTLALAVAALTALSSLTFQARAWQGDAKRKLGYTDTPMQPYGKFRVHDGTRPQPPVITPGTASTQETPGRAPSDSVVLFDGSDLSKWHGGGKLVDGTLEIGGGSPTSNEEFGDCQLHLEFATPTPPKGIDQGRGNSGVMLFGRYEFQVLDSYENVTYPDGQAGAIYGQYPPLVNASRKPGDWQTYDIIFTAPRFTKEGAVETPAFATVLLNGVLLHNHTPLLGAVAFKAVAKYSPHGPKGPIVLQDHGNPVRYRNIWVRSLKNYDEP